MSFQLLNFLMLGVAGFSGYHIGRSIRSSELLQARFDGCKAIEDMAMERGSEAGYNTTKLWEDLFQ